MKHIINYCYLDAMGVDNQFIYSTNSFFKALFHYLKYQLSGCYSIKWTMGEKVIVNKTDLDNYYI